MNNLPTVINCQACGKTFQPEYKKTFLGFWKCLCSGCNKDSVFPLSSGYRRAYRKTRLNFGALKRGNDNGSEPDAETRSIMEAQSERLYAETKAILSELRPLTDHLVNKLLEAHEINLVDALREVA